MKNAQRSLPCAAFALIFGLAMGGLSAAHADDNEDQANVPVGKRVHPHLQPEGVHVGTLLFYPRLDAGVLYDSNVFASAGDAEEDFVYVVAPQLIVRKDDEVLRHELSLAVKHMEFQQFSAESRTEAEARLRSAWEFADGLTLDSNFSAARQFEQRGDSLTALGSVSPIGYFDLRAAAFVTKRFNDLGVTVGGGVRNLIYEDGRTPAGISIDQSFRDGTIVQASLRPFYEFSPGYRIYASLNVNQRDYAGNGERDRNSQGFDARGGLEFLLTPIVFGSVEAGYLEQYYDNPSIPTAQGVSGKTTLTWLMTPLMTVSIFGARSVAEIAAPDQSARLDLIAGAQLDYEIMRNLVASTAVKFRNEEFSGSARNDDVFDVDTRLDYTPNQYLSFGLYYLYTERQSNFDGFSFDRHRMMFNVSARY